MTVMFNRGDFMGLIYDRQFPAFKVLGNLYSVGNIAGSVHILDTEEGLIVFDTGYIETFGYVIDRMWRFGLDPKNIIAIFLTHGHVDHVGGAKKLREMSGAKIYISNEDRQAVTGENDLIFDKELGLKFTEFFEPDVLIADKDVFTFGKTAVRCEATPGHTAGAMSFFFDVTDGDRKYKTAIHGGAGLLTMSKDYLTRKNLPFSLRDDFIAAMDRLKNEEVDLYIGNHLEQNNTAEKYKMLCDGNELAFVNPNEWKDYCESCIAALKGMIEKEG